MMKLYVLMLASALSLLQLTHAVTLQSSIQFQLRLPIMLHLLGGLSLRLLYQSKIGVKQDAMPPILLIVGLSGSLLQP